MKRHLAIIGLAVAVTYMMTGCEDSTAQSKIEEQKQIIQGMSERIAMLEGAVAEMQRKTAGEETQARTDRDRLAEIQALVNSRLNAINTEFQTQLLAMREDVQQMNKLITDRAAEDEAINVKLKDGQLYNENIRTEMETFFQNRMETTLDTMLDNRLRDVYPYLYYHKQY
ncbi:MAG: hypothetical protein ABIH86_04075 [Planctomycetota bacterium]